MRKSGFFLVLPFLALAVTACDEEQAPVEEPIRALKTVTITEVASGQVRKFSGVVRATDTSSLSFQVGGKVVDVRANLGDRVAKGQVLAVLDAKSYEIGVQGAEASLSRARAARKEAELEFERKKSLYEKNWVAKAAFDQAVASLESATGEETYALSQLNLAKRDLANTKLTAPFDGTIAKREVEPYVEVSPGKVLFEISAAGALEIALDIPETVIKGIIAGMPVRARFSTAPGAVAEGRVTEVGSTAGQANSFPVTASLLSPPAGIRAGMTAEVEFTMAKDRETAGYLVPLSAIAPGPGEDAGFVFVYDASASVVRRTAVRGRPGRDNMVEITDGVNAGDVVAVAGVTFLRDGQKVKLMTP